MNRSMTVEMVPDGEFVMTPYVEAIIDRARRYIDAGFPVHFRGPAGTGKSTMAKHLANTLGKPIALLYGDESLTSSTLVGGESGYRYKRIRDNFISSVLKEEEEVTKSWVDNKLTEACKHGYTFIYDEFTRSRPETNNILLSVLQDRVLSLPGGTNQLEPYLRVHDDFTAIFTSNPGEYVGTFRSQDALRDRMITIDLDYPDYETELEIVYAKARLPMDVCELITNTVRALRDSHECDFSPTIRAGIMVAKTLTSSGLDPEDDMNLFTTYCQDILSSEAGPSNQREIKTAIAGIVKSLVSQQKRFKVI